VAKPDRLLKSKETARRLAVSESTVDNLAAAGHLTKIPASAGGKSVRYRESEVEAFMRRGVRAASVSKSAGGPGGNPQAAVDSITRARRRAAEAAKAEAEAQRFRDYLAYLAAAPGAMGRDAGELLAKMDAAERGGVQLQSDVLTKQAGAGRDWPLP
jgi:excisionase family DNA binding protein